MMYHEVILMEEKAEEKREPIAEQAEEKFQGEPYVPRPWWQIAGAWIGLVLFILSAALLFMYVLHLY